MWRALATLLLWSVMLGCAAAAAPASAPVPHVTLIGDSVADAVGLGEAKDILSSGVELELELAPCRRIADSSCPFNGVRPPTLLDLVQSLGTGIGPTVIVAVGYNDFEDDYAHEIDLALAALRGAGVKRVIWATLRAAQHPYLNMNDDIVVAAATHPEMTVADWNLYSRSHPEWFQPDGIHLNGPGAQAMATFFHQVLVQLGVIGQPAAPAAPSRPLLVATRTVPDSVRGLRYTAKLAASGGRPPYFWSFLSHPPRGLHLRPTGWLFGTPRGRPGTFEFQVRVADASGSAVTQQLELRVLP